MSRHVSRRTILKTTAFIATSAFVAPARALADRPASLNEKLNVGFVGVNNRAAADLADTSRCPAVRVAAICDVDDAYLAIAAQKHPSAETYNDFRHMIEGEKDLDAVVVATPDHIHAAAALWAMKAGKHVYCEKPLARTLGEARRMIDTARQKRLVTQMGTQIHAENNYRRVVEIIKSRSIGPVREVHVFCSKSWATTQPARASEKIPKDLHYDLWLGPAAERPYSPDYLPANWRRYWAFGSGTLGDMGCHYIDLPFWALDLKYPVRASAEGPAPHAEWCPRWLITHWEFPARGEQPPVKLSWYDGGKRPKALSDWEVNPNWRDGVLFVGDKGALFADYNQYKLYPEDDFADFKAPPRSIAKSVGHHREWVNACLANDPEAPLCRFDYSGPLAETVLLGTVAFRLGKALEWDAQNLRATNAPQADGLIHQPWRKGWDV